jgi:hypothetical protein
MGRPGFRVRNDTGILDFGAGGPIENQRLLLHGALSVWGGGPGFAERVEGPRALFGYRCESTAEAARRTRPALVSTRPYTLDGEVLLSQGYSPNSSFTSAVAL